jgi:hypothetical protein
MNHGSAAGIVTGCGLDYRGVGVPSRVKSFHFSICSRPALGAHQASHPMGTGALSPGEKRPGCEADHSLQTDHSHSAIAQVKKRGIYTSTPLPPPAIRLPGVVLS